MISSDLMSLALDGWSLGSFSRMGVCEAIRIRFGGVVPAELNNRNQTSFESIEPSTEIWKTPDSAWQFHVTCGELDHTWMGQDLNCPKTRTSVTCPVAMLLGSARDICGNSSARHIGPPIKEAIAT